jgi:hypothetical protein
MNWNGWGCKEFRSGFRAVAAVLHVSLSPELRQEPEHEREYDAHEEGAGDRKIKSGVFAAMDDVARKAAESKRKFRREIEECAGAREDQAENDQGTAEIAVQIHKP